MAIAPPMASTFPYSLDSPPAPSVKVTRTLPVRATTKPSHMRGVGFSSKKRTEIKNTHKGWVVTKTTELATLVCSREVIQRAKCSASMSPAPTASVSWFLVNLKPRPSLKAKGRKNRAEKNMR